MTRSLLVLLLLLVTYPLTYPLTASAGPIESPAASDIKPGEPDIRVVRYDYSGGGFLLSDDGGDSWRMMCNSQIDVSVQRETNGVVIGAGGTIYTGAIDGMWQGSADGCSWERIAALDGKWIKDLVHHPSDPGVLFAVSSNGGEFENGIHRYDPDADEWSALGTQEQILIRALRVIELPGGGLRFYESIARGTLAGGTAPNYIIRYSDDDGANWTEHPYGEAGGTLALLGVDPTDPDRIAIAITSEAAVDQVLVSDAGGAEGSWAVALQPEEFGGAAFGPEGQLWVGDMEAGLYEVTTPGDGEVQLSQRLRPRCVEYHPDSDELIVCGLFEWGRVDRVSGELETLLDLREQDGWVQCNGESVAGLCESDLGVAGWCGPTHYPEAPVCEDYGYPGVEPPEPDAGPGAGGTGGGADAGSETPSDDSGCGCRTVGAQPPSERATVTWLLGLSLLIAARRRRPRR